MKGMNSRGGGEHSDRTEMILHERSERSREMSRKESDVRVRVRNQLCFEKKKTPLLLKAFLSETISKR